MTSAASSTDKTLRLHDGRLLGYAEYGNPRGKPLFYFHGHTSSRLEARFLAHQALQKDVRLIGIDRPGMGLSTYKARRHILDWPEDVVELADDLGIDRFAVAGLSGGGPYVLTCAFKIPNRLLACGIISGAGHFGRFLSFLSLWLPWLLLPVSKRFFADIERAKKTLVRVRRRWVEPDRKALSSPDVLETLAASLVEGLRQGVKGAACDGKLLGQRDWGFTPENIRFPNIYLWHGELDKEVPIAQGRQVAESLGQCHATFYPDEGHISVIVNHQEEIVKTLLSGMSMKEAL